MISGSDLPKPLDKFRVPAAMDFNLNPAQLNAEQSRDAVMVDVAEFLGPIHHQDDQTLVVPQVL